MKIFNLDSGEDICCDDEELQIIDPTGSFSVEAWDFGECDTQIINLNSGTPVQVFIPGAPGSTSGLYAVVTVGTLIQANQIYTVVNSSSPTTQSLPLISTLISGNFTTPYTISNVGAGTVTIAASGGDSILYPTPSLPYQYTSMSFLPTTLGWVAL